MYLSDIKSCNCPVAIYTRPVAIYIHPVAMTTDGTASPQFELCVTLTAFPEFRTNIDLCYWLVYSCQSKQTL